jgi:uncharacterized membrane protein
MQNFLSELDKLAAVGSYYIAAGALVVSIITLFGAFAAIFVTMKTFREDRNTELARREDEIRHRRNAEVFEIFKIITGLKDTRGNEPDGAVMIAHQSAALVALRDYPEFHDALLVQKRYFDNRRDSIHTVWMRHQIDSTFEYWRLHNSEKLMRHALVDARGINNHLDRLEQK